MKAGFHFVEDSDPSPPLGAATYLDVGGYRAGQRSSEQMCRVYFKGRPDIPALAASANRFGAHIQLGNELNHPNEQYPGTVADYLADYRAFKKLARGVVYWCPPSPGFAGWQSWLDGAEEADGICLHCYGLLDEMKATVVYAVLRFPGKPLWIGECNFGPGPGRIVDLSDWAHNHFKPFLDWCASIPEVEAVTYFAYKWPTPDMQQGTRVDGAGTAVETILREWRQPMVWNPAWPPPIDPFPDDPAQSPQEAPMDAATQAKLDQLLAQNALITQALIAFREGRWTGADGVDGMIVALNGGKLPDGYNPVFPSLA